MKKKRTVRRIAGYAARHPVSLAALLLAALLSGAIDIATPYWIGKAVDGMIGPHAVDFGAVGLFALILLVTAILRFAAAYLLNALSNRIANAVVRAMRADAFAQMNRLPLSFFDGTPHGDIISRFVNDADAVAEGLFQAATQLFLGTVVVTGTLIVMLTLNHTVTAAVLTTTALAFATAFFITRFTHKYFNKQQELVGRLNGLAEETIEGARTIAAFSYEDAAEAHFNAVNRELYTAGRRAQFGSALTNPTTRLVNNLAYISVGVVGGLLAGLSPGGISSFILYANLFARPFNDLTAVATQLMAAHAAAGRLFALMDEDSETPDPPDALSPAAFDGRVAFDHVSFSYQPQKPLIADLNLRVDPGSKVAIVGPTGAGKTTLVNLLMRFYDVNAGAISVDCADVRRMKRDTLRRAFAMVLQETWLFTGTVRDNIAYGAEASDEEIIAAAKASRAHSFIKRLPEGYDTLITGSGGPLSGGQEQLITITRAMLTNPAMLILDEATSSVDTLTERAIQQSFDRMMKGRTSFVIAHRLSTIRDADLILVMREGNIVEQGTHQELLSEKGLYYELYRSQFEGGE